MAKNGGKTRQQAPRLSATLAVLWRSLCRDVFDPYRPELHYMRGPGPKWRAKHGIAEPGRPAAASAGTNARPAAA